MISSEDVMRSMLKDDNRSDSPDTPKTVEENVPKVTTDAESDHNSDTDHEGESIYTIYSIDYTHSSSSSNQRRMGRRR